MPKRKSRLIRKTLMRVTETGRTKGGRPTGTMITEQRGVDIAGKFIPTGRKKILKATGLFKR